MTDSTQRLADGIIGGFDRALRTLWGEPPRGRAMPGATIDAAPLSAEERAHAAALMRVNHCGEICAQALYEGQALVARNRELQSRLAQAAAEEADHLRWTRQRLNELGGRASVLDPLFYAGALGLGVLAGAAGTRWNLGFLAETERQVERHLASHLGRLPAADERSRAVVQQMQADEAGHARMAEDNGAALLPQAIRLAMRWSARVMTGSAYYL